MIVEFNVNENVLVKLTDEGVNELKRQHKELRDEFPNIGGAFTPPVTDDEGWSKFQMHDLMNRFGHMMVMGAKLPFETTIRLDVSSEG